jgi:uncharacterized membrane-anchored protein
MRAIHVPTVDTRYWLAIALASVFGTNLGDYYAHESGLGMVLGVIVLAALTLPVFALERYDPRTHAIYYWLVIIIIRTGATNIADFLQFREHIPQLPLCLVLAGSIAAFGFWQHRARNARGAEAASAPVGMPDSGAAYWLAMLGAGVFGTVLGDFSSTAVGHGTACIALTLLFAVTLAFWRQAPRAPAAIYWVTVAVARTAGTAIGDWLAESRDLGIGLAAATVISGVAFVGLLLPGRRRTPDVA